MLLVIGASLFIYVGRAHADSQGPKGPGTAAGTSWTSPGNITAQDSVYASYSIASGGTTTALQATNFGFTIPTGSTINGVQADVWKYSPTVSKSSVQDSSVQIIKGGTAGGTSQAITGTAWPTTNTMTTYGGSTNLWGQTLAVSDVNASNFGISLTATNVKSGGGATNVAYVDYIQVTIYYTPPPLTVTQASYRLFNNLDTTTPDVGTPLAAQNTAATLTGDGQPFRLRTDVGMAGSTVAANAASFKLQYAPMTTSCDTSFTNTPSSAYQDVTDSSTVQYYQNTYATNGTTIQDSNSYGPTDGTKTIANGGIIPETYQGKGTTTFTNPTAIPAGDDGMWDFALTTYHTFQNTHFCLRIIQSTGSALDTYTVIPEIVLPASTITQSSYRWFNNNNGGIATFATAWGGAGNDDGYATVQTSDGGYAVTGYTASYGNGTAGASNMFLAKYDSTGALSWSRTWGGTANDAGKSIVQTSDGGYAVTGYTTSYTGHSGYNDMFLAKFDSTGTLSWSTTWGGSGGNTEGNSIVQTSDGGYAVAGDTTAFNFYHYNDAFLIKFDSTGTVSWFHTWMILADSTGKDWAYSVIQTSDGGYIMTGSANAGGSSGTDMFLAKYDSTGALSWSRTWGGTGSDIGYGIVQTSDGGYAITGETTSYGAGDYDMFLAKYDSTGTLSWSRTWGGTLNDIGQSIVQTSDGSYAITGTTSSYGNGNGDMFLAKYDSTGALSWLRTWGGTASDDGYSVIQTSDGGYAITGDTQSYGGGGYDMFLIKYDSNGVLNGCTAPVCQTPVGVTGSPSASDTPQSITSTTPTTSSSASPTAATTSPTANTTVIYALSYSAVVGPAWFGPNKVGDLPATGTPFRLRLLLSLSNTGIGVGGQSFKLQYAMRTGGATCSTVTYGDVTTTSTVSWYDNSALNDGAGVAVNANDPTDGSNTVVPQSYGEANNFTTTANLYVNQDGMWDFSLIVPTGTNPGADICMRVVQSDGTAFPAANYTNYPEIQYGPTNQQHMRQGAWFDQNGVKQPLFTSKN